jgi:hypothetical protein
VSTKASSFRRTVARWLGFDLGWLPIVVLIGLAYLLVTLPELFDATARMNVGSSVGHSVLTELQKLADGTKPWFDRPEAKDVSKDLTVAALLAAPALWLAALVRSARAHTWRPFAVSVGAVLAGLIALPALTWAAELVVTLFRVAVWLFHEVARFIAWISPVLAVLIVAVVAIAAIAALVAVIALIHQARRWPTAAAVVAVVAALGLAWRLGMFDGLFTALRRIVQAIAEWISTYVGPVVAAIVAVAFLVVIALAVLGAVVALFGHVGRTIVLPFASAGSAGRKEAECLDTAAGLGVALSMPFTATVIDPQYRKEFLIDWLGIPVLRTLPSPVELYDFLLRDRALHVLAPAFNGFNPTVDFALAVLATAIAVLSLLFGQPGWSIERERSNVLNPIMAAAGVAIALAIPALLVTWWAKTHQDG